jgi:hypothetical protein
LFPAATVTVTTPPGTAGPLYHTEFVTSSGAAGIVTPLPSDEQI